MTRIRMPYDVDNPIAGQEISSTYEGRHILIREEWLIHPDHTDIEGNDFVRKGDPICSYGLGAVGIALKTAHSEDDVIPIDTEGIWWLEVEIVNGVWEGQPLFIDANGVVTDDPSLALTVFGYVLHDYLLGDSDPEYPILPVKVHWMFSWFWWGE